MNKLTKKQKELIVDESLVKADHDLTFASNDLREALNSASAVESIILLPLIGQVVSINRAVVQLLAARKG